MLACVIGFEEFKERWHQELINNYPWVQALVFVRARKASVCWKPHAKLVLSFLGDKFEFSKVFEVNWKLFCEIVAENNSRGYSRRSADPKIPTPDSHLKYPHRFSWKTFELQMLRPPVQFIRVWSFRIATKNLSVVAWVRSELWHVFQDSYQTVICISFLRCAQILHDVTRW